MPGIAAHAIARIPERVVLQPLLGEPDARAPGEEPRPVRRDEMREPATEPEMPVQPESAAHRVDHAIATTRELAPFEEEGRGVARRGDAGWRGLSAVAHWQAMTPSAVAGAWGAIVPEKIAHVSGYDCGCVAVAAQPPAVAPVIVRLTPFDPRNWSAVVSDE